MLLAEPQIRRWTRREYSRLGAEGWFDGQRVQLINGEIIQMAPMGYEHTRGRPEGGAAAGAYFRADGLRPLPDAFGGGNTETSRSPMSPQCAATMKITPTIRLQRCW